MLSHQTPILPTAHGLPMPEISWDFGPAAAYAQEPDTTLEKDNFVTENIEFAYGETLWIGYKRVVSASLWQKS